MPSCLSVDRATIFFMSNSNMALALAISMVITPITNTNVQRLVLSLGLNRINRYTPAVTRVDEWTKEDTGVGAAIAAGNQAENGIWALLVIAAKIIKLLVAVPIGPSLANSSLERLPNWEVTAIMIRIATSPTRFVTAVSMPALLALALLKYTIKRYEVTPNPSHPSRITSRLGLTISVIIDATNPVINR